MSKLHVHYPDRGSHPELTEADITVLRKHEAEVLKAATLLLGVNADPHWVYIPGHTEKYFEIRAHTKHLGPLSIRFLEAQSPEVLYKRLETLALTEDS